MTKDSPLLGTSCEKAHSAVTAYVCFMPSVTRFSGVEDRKSSTMFLLGKIHLFRLFCTRLSPKHRSGKVESAQAIVVFHKWLIWGHSEPQGRLFGFLYRNLISRVVLSMFQKMVVGCCFILLFSKNAWNLTPARDEGFTRVVLLVVWKL